MVDLQSGHASNVQCVHLVDDDEALRDSLVWLTESQGFKVAAYDSAEAFLGAWSPDMAGCLVLDVRMPGMSGLELYERLMQMHSTLPVIPRPKRSDRHRAATAKPIGLPRRPAPPPRQCYG